MDAPSDKVYQLLAQVRWFSLGTPASSATKTGRNDITEILWKVALNTKNQIKSNCGMELPPPLFVDFLFNRDFFIVSSLIPLLIVFVSM